MTADLRVRRLRGALFLASLLVGSACQRVQPGPEDHTAHLAAAAATERTADGAAEGDMTGASIFDLDVPLTDQDGRPVALRDLAGHRVIVAMTYTSCSSVCPRITEDMKRVETRLGVADADVRLVLFSLDAKRDTPTALQAFARDHRLRADRWRLLASTDDGVRDLAAVLGVKYVTEPSGEIAHSAIITVLDDRGIVRHRQVGLGQDPETLVSALAAARR